MNYTTIELCYEKPLKNFTMRQLEYFIEMHGRKIFIAFIAIMAFVALYFSFDAVKEFFIGAEKYLKNLHKI